VAARLPWHRERLLLYLGRALDEALPARGACVPVPGSRGRQRPGRPDRSAVASLVHRAAPTLLGNARVRSAVMSSELMRRI
jgi:hypothetical protein